MIAVIAELTLVDLVATQGISPGLTARHFGMAAASPFVALSADSPAAVGLRRATRAGLCLALAGVGLMLRDWLPAALLGMALVAVGTFLAQALATGFVSRAARGDRAAARGPCLVCCFGAASSERSLSGRSKRSGAGAGLRSAGVAMTALDRRPALGAGRAD